MSMKVCQACNSMKELSDFWVSRNGRTRDGYMNTCKTCSKAARAQWITPEKESEYNAKAYQKVRLTEPVRQRVRKNQLNRLARQQAAYVEDVEPYEVYHRSNGICGICSMPVSYDSFHVDHIIPLARGGEHSYKNTQASHPKCNMRKGART